MPIRGGDQGNKDKHSSDEWGFNVQYWVDAWALETSFIYLNYVDKNLHGMDVNRFFAAQAVEGGLWSGPKY